MTEIINIKSNIIKYINNFFNINKHVSLNSIDTSSNIIINNTLEVGYTNDTKDLNKLNNASIKLLDRNDSIFKEIYINDNDLYIIPKNNNNNSIISYNPVKFVRIDELETIVNDEVNPFIISNLKIDDPGTIRFTRDQYPSTITNTEIGFRQHNGRIEFKNQSYTNWIPLAQGSGAVNFYDLGSINFQKASADIGDYIILDSNKDLINTKLNIIDDITPQLGGDLDADNNNIKFTSNTGIKDDNDKQILTFLDNTSLDNNTYLSIRKDRNSNDEDFIELRSESTSNASTNFKISTRGSGDLDFDLTNELNSNKGDVVIKANEFNLADIESFNMSTGKFISSINLINISSSTAGLSELTSKLVNINTETLVLVNSNNNIDYYIHIDSGINGQKLNIIYESYNSTGNVILLFKNNVSTNYVGTGSGLANQLIFSSSGQSASFQYLEIYTSGPNVIRNRWQILNTGCFVN